MQGVLSRARTTHTQVLYSTVKSSPASDLSDHARYLDHFMVHLLHSGLSLVASVSRGDRLGMLRYSHLSAGPARMR